MRVYKTRDHGFSWHATFYIAFLRHPILSLIAPSSRAPLDSFSLALPSSKCRVLPCSKFCWSLRTHGSLVWMTRARMSGFFHERRWVGGSSTAGERVNHVNGNELEVSETVTHRKCTSFGSSFFSHILAKCKFLNYTINLPVPPKDILYSFRIWRLIINAFGFIWFFLCKR